MDKIQSEIAELFYFAIYKKSKHSNIPKYKLINMISEKCERTTSTIYNWQRTGHMPLYLVPILSEILHPFFDVSYILKK